MPDKQIKLHSSLKGEINDEHVKIYIGFDDNKQIYQTFDLNFNAIQNSNWIPISNEKYSKLSDSLFEVLHNNDDKKTITLNKVEIINKGLTTKYWRDVECKPQTVELKSWSTEHPLFYLKGVVVNSHDQKEIGQEKDVCVQTYSFYIEPKIKEGIYTINEPLKILQEKNQSIINNNPLNIKNMENTTENQEKTVAAVKINYQAVKGNLTSEPEIKSLESGLKVANFSIKQSYPIGTPQEGKKQEYVNNYHNVVAFGEQAEAIEKASFKKGDFIEAEGKASFFSYQKDGAEGMNYSNKIIANNIQKLEAGVKPFQQHNNYIELKGNLTKNPEIKNLPSGKTIATISVAHNYKIKGNEEHVMFVNATIYNQKTIDAIVNSNMEKGSTISLKGSVEPTTYIDKNQNNRYSVSINANFVQLDKSKEVVIDHTNNPTPEIAKETSKKPSAKKEAAAVVENKVKKEAPAKTSKKDKGLSR